MADKSERQFHGGSVYSDWSERLGRRVYRLQKRWFDPELGKTKKFTELVPSPYKRRTGARAATSKPLTGLAAAQAFKKDLENLDQRGEWIPTSVQRRLQVNEAKDAKQQRDDREDLLFEKAWPAYLSDLEAQGSEYADQTKAQRAFERLELFWRGFYLDAITPADVRRFYTARMNAAAPFKKLRKVSIRTPQVEMTFVAALHKHLREDHPALPLRPWPIQPASGKKNSAFAPYRRKHEFQVPTDDRLRPLLQAMFTAESAAKNGHLRIKDTHRALWMLTFFTAARPVSEPCRLRCGDVEFLKDGWALVSYTDTKNEHSKRTLPVPPQVADALRSIMPPRPDLGCEDWLQTPVFAKRGNGQPWQQSTYMKAWEATMEALVAEYPEVEGMWPRDLRPTARTAMRRAGIASEVRRRYLGHAPADVDEGYDRVAPEELREAAEALDALVYGETAMGTKTNSAPAALPHSA